MESGTELMKSLSPSRVAQLLEVVDASVPTMYTDVAGIYQAQAAEKQPAAKKE